MFKFLFGTVLAAAGLLGFFGDERMLTADIRRVTGYLLHLSRHTPVGLVVIGICLFFAIHFLVKWRQEAEADSAREEAERDMG